MSQGRDHLQLAKEFMDPEEGKDDPTYETVIYRAFFEALARAQLLQNLDKAPKCSLSFEARKDIRGERKEETSSSSHTAIVDISSQGELSRSICKASIYSTST